MYARSNLSASRTILITTALTIAFGFAGCKSTPTTPTDDAGLTAALQSRIAADSALSNEAIQSSVQKQVATLLCSYQEHVVASHGGSLVEFDPDGD